MDTRAGGCRPKRVHPVKTKSSIAIDPAELEQWKPLIRVVLASLTRLKEHRLASQLSDATGFSATSYERQKLSEAALNGDWQAVQDIIDQIDEWDPKNKRKAILHAQKQHISELVSEGNGMDAATLLRTNASLTDSDLAELATIICTNVPKSATSRQERSIAASYIRSLLPKSSSVSPKRLHEIIGAAKSMRMLRKAGHLEAAKGGRKAVEATNSEVKGFIADFFAILGFTGGPRLQASVIDNIFIEIGALASKGKFEEALEMIVNSSDRHGIDTVDYQDAIEALLSSAMAHSNNALKTLNLLREYGSHLPESTITTMSSQICFDSGSNYWSSFLGRHVSKILEDAVEYETLVDPYALSPSKSLYTAPDPEETVQGFPGKCVLSVPFGSAVWIAEPSPDGSYLAVTSRYRNVVTLFGLKPEPHKLWECPTKHSRLYAEAIAWHPELPMFALGLSIMWVFFWDVHRKEPIGCFRLEDSHGSPRRSDSSEELEEVGVGALMWLPQNHFSDPFRLLCGWLDGTLELREFVHGLHSPPVRTWVYPSILRTRSMSVLCTAPGHLKVLVLGAQAGGEQQLVILDAMDWATAELTTFKLENDQISIVALPESGKETVQGPRHAAIMSSREGLVLIDRKGTSPDLHFKGPIQGAFVVPIRFAGYKDKFLLSGTESSKRSQYGYVFNRYTGERVAKLKGHKSMVNSISWSGEYIITTSDDGRLRFFGKI